MISVRTAQPVDYPEMSRVLIASIVKLCVADHRNDPEALAAWIGNKSVDGIAKMATKADLFVALIDKKIAAVGAIGGDTVGLNYVDPAYRGMGVSTALMLGLKEVMVDRGVRLARLISSRTAHAFYLRRGWLDDGPPMQGQFIESFPMSKRLQEG